VGYCVFSLFVKSVNNVAVILVDTNKICGVDRQWSVKSLLNRLDNAERILDIFDDVFRRLLLIFCVDGLLLYLSSQHSTV